MRSVFAGIFILIVVNGLVACGDDPAVIDPDRLTISIVSVTPEAGFIPAEIEFVAEVTAGSDVVVDELEITWDFGDNASSSGSLIQTHRYEQEGTFLVRVTARERNGSGDVIGEADASTSIDVFARADLRASIPFLDSRAVRSQDDLRVTFDLFNDASAVPVAFTTGVYLSTERLIDRSNPPDSEALAGLVAAERVFRIAGSDFESFDAQPATENIDITEIRVPASVPSGQYEVFVYVDEGGVVGEHDEANNIQFSPNQLDFINTASEGPDLAVSDVRGRPSRANSLETLTVDVDLVNHGTEPAVFFDYTGYFSFANDTIDESDEVIAEGSLDGIGAGDSLDLETIEHTFAEPVVIIGNYFVIVEVDSAGEVEESNESNNVSASSQIVVTDEPIPGTDLIPTAFAFDPLTTFLDGSVTVSASILNQGSEPTPSQFFCSIYLSDDDDLDAAEDFSLDNFNLPVLAADEERAVEKVTRIPGFITPGLYHAFLFCDPTFGIPEADDDNNIIKADNRLEISADPEVDLRIGNLTLSPSTVENGSELTIDWEICNDGTNGIGPSLARINISQDAILDVNDTVLFEQMLDGVDANTCRSISTTVTARCDTFHPNYNVFAAVDVTNLVPEVDETNNELLLDTTLTIEGTICVCEIDPLEADNDSPATPTYVSARTYCDLTMCDTAVDWYAIPLQRGETVRVVVTFENERGNLDVTLRAADRATVLDRSESDGDREEVIAFVVPETGDYLLKVGGRTEQDVNAYCMTVEVSPPQEGTDLIVSGIELSEERPVLGEEVEVAFEVINLGDVDADANTVRLYLSEDVEIDPATDLLLGDLELGDGVRGSSLIRRTVDVEMPASGDGGSHYLGVVADALNDVPGELDETNNIGVSDLFELDARCFDALEPNNDIDDAYSISLVGDVTTIDALLACSDNRDFYEICGEFGEFIRMRTRFDPEDGDIDMRLYEEGGTQIARAEGTASEEFLEVDYLTADQCYFLEVLVVGRDREVPYDLVIENGDAPPELVCSSAGEPNDSFNSAAQLVDHLDPLESDLAVCPVADVDYYRFDVTSGTQLTIRLLPVDGEEEVPTDLRMSLWDRTQRFIYNTISANEPVIATTTTSGIHYLRVQSLADGVRNQRYQIEIEGLDGTDLTIDEFAIDPAAVNVGERVQYNFTVANSRTLAAGGFHYAVYLSEDPVIDTDDTLLREVDQAGLTGGTSRSEGNKVTIPLDTEPDTLQFIGVVIDNLEEVDEHVESNNIALLPLQILADCSHDIAEPNDARIDAQELVGDDGFLDVDLNLCSGDEDWFRFEALPDTSYQFTATFSAEDGDLDLFAYDGALGYLGSGETLGDNEDLIFTTPESEEDTVTVYVVAEPFGASNLTYQLTQVLP